MKAVTSRENAAYKSVAKLVASAAERRSRSLSVLDGTHLLAAFLDSGRKPEALYVDARGAADPEVARLAERSAPARATLLSDSLFNAISTVESPTGVISVVRTPGSQAAPADAPLVLLLEGIQDPGNVGTLLRSAAAAGASHVVLSPGCAFAWSPKVLRAAMGAHFALGIEEGADLAAYLRSYRGTSVALSPRAKASIHDVDLSERCALLVGSEGAGLTPALEAAANVRARIPMPGRMESLNAATAGSLALFECVRQRVNRSEKR